MKQLLFIIFLLTFQLSFTADWKLEKDEDGIKVYTREIPNSDFLEYKGITYVNVPTEKAAEVVLRISDYINWFPDCLESKRLKIISPRELIVYYVIDSPWPVKNRDAVVRLNIRREDDTKAIIIDFETATGFKKELPNIVRVPKSSGYWKFEQIGSKTKITYQNHADPGGSVPSWVVNMFVVDAPYETLLSIKNKLK